MLKINVDRVAHWKPGPAGCSGVLCDHTGEILALLAGLLGSLDSNESIIKALQMVIDSRWSAAYRFIIESYSQAAISWCCSSTDRLWKYWDLFKLVDCLCTKFIEIGIRDSDKQVESSTKSMKMNMMQV